MKRLLLVSLGIVLAIAADTVIGGPVPEASAIVADGKSAYQIVIPKQATAVERKAAEELDYIPMPESVVKLIEKTWSSDIKS